jgi:hypothetical protein
MRLSLACSLTPTHFLRTVINAIQEGHVQSNMGSQWAVVASASAGSALAAGAAALAAGAAAFAAGAAALARGSSRAGRSAFVGGPSPAG